MIIAVAVAVTVAVGAGGGGVEVIVVVVVVAMMVVVLVLVLVIALIAEVGSMSTVRLVLSLFVSVWALLNDTRGRQRSKMTDQR